jgi:hypothetical protein
MAYSEAVLKRYRILKSEIEGYDAWLANLEIIHKRDEEAYQMRKKKVQDDRAKCQKEMDELGEI